MDSTISFKKLRIAILISGRGSNMESLIRASLYDISYTAEIICVISNNNNSKGLSIAADKYKIPTFIIKCLSSDFSDIHRVLSNNRIDLICLAGFMQIISDQSFLSYWNGRIINIHPSLLPSFKGLHAQKQALDFGVKISGCSVHYVAREVDSGPIIFQAAVPILNDDNVETLSLRILKAENVIYPIAVKLISSNKISVLKNRTLSSNEDLFLI